MSNSGKEEFRGNRNIGRLQKISQTKQEIEIQRTLELGLEAADSIMTEVFHSSVAVINQRLRVLTHL